MPRDQLDILAFGVHFEDLLLGCGGILAKSSHEGKRIGLAALSKKKLSAVSSAQKIGADPLFLDFPEGPITDSYPHRLKLVETLRITKPRLVLAPMWEANPVLDQQELGKMLRYACRFARFAKILPEVPIHRPEGILHYLSPMQPYPPDFILDISPYFNLWMEMLACFENKDLQDQGMRVASQRGLMIGKDYAQGLVQGNPVEVHDLMSISRGTLEL